MRASTTRLRGDAHRLIDRLLARGRDFLERCDVAGLRRAIRNRLAQHHHLRQAADGDRRHRIGEPLVVRVLQGRRVGLASGEIARHMRDGGHPEHAPVARGLDARAPGIGGDGLLPAPVHVLAGGDEHGGLAGRAAGAGDDSSPPSVKLFDPVVHVLDLDGILRRHAMAGDRVQPFATGGPSFSPTSQLSG